MIEEEIVFQTRPVVVEEVVVGKRLMVETQTVSASVLRERARIRPTGAE